MVPLWHHGVGDGNELPSKAKGRTPAEAIGISSGTHAQGGVRSPSRHKGSALRTSRTDAPATRDVDAGFINVLHDRFIRGVHQYGAEMLLLVTREPLSRAAGMRMQEFADKRWVQVSGLADEEGLDKTIDQLIGKLYWEN